MHVLLLLVLYSCRLYSLILPPGSNEVVVMAAHPGLQSTLCLGKAIYIYISNHLLANEIFKDLFLQNDHFMAAHII